MWKVGIKLDRFAVEIDFDGRSYIKLPQRDGNVIGITVAFHRGNGKFHKLSHSFRNDHKVQRSTVVRSSAIFKRFSYGASQVSGTLFSSSRGDFVKEPVMICIGLNGGSSCIAGFVR